MRLRTGRPAVIVLAGGQASRLPHKLELDMGGIPMLARVLDNARCIGPVYVSASAPLSQTLASHVDVPIVLDDAPGRGPLGGLLSACARIDAPAFFALAGDVPFFDASAAERLDAALLEGDEAAVPADAAGRLQPLCALYDRKAFLREAAPLCAHGAAPMRALLERLRVRRVEMPDTKLLLNVNTPADRDRLIECSAPIAV